MHQAALNDIAPIDTYSQLLNNLNTESNHIDEVYQSNALNHRLGQRLTLNDGTLACRQSGGNMSYL